MRNPTEARGAVVTTSANASAVAGPVTSGRVAAVPVAARVAVVEDGPPDAATVLDRLRDAFPHWAFLHDAGRWTACRGRGESGVTLVKGDPVALRMAVSEAERYRPC